MAEILVRPSRMRKENMIQPNGSIQKTGSVLAFAAGASLVAPVLRKRSPWRWVAAAGGALVYAGARASRSNGRASSKIQFVEQTITIDRPAAELSAMWRNPQVLDRVMRPFGSVMPEGPDRLRWTIDIPVHGTLTGEALKVEERAGELVHWRTVPGTAIEIHEWLVLKPEQNGRGTEVTLRYRIDYAHVSSGALLSGLTYFFKGAPRSAVLKVLHNLKAAAESGDFIAAPQRTNLTARIG